jgi:beta-xylosidase
MNRLIPSIFVLLAVLSTACASSAAPSPTATPPPSLTSTSIPTGTKPAPTDTPIPTATATEIPIFWDDFSGEFQPGWSWIRENDALWSLDSEPGFLRIVLTGDRPPRNLLVRDVTSENFQVMTHVRFTPTSNFQFAGLRIQQDDETAISLGRAYCNTQNVCVGNGIYFDAVQNGQWTGKNFGTDTQVKDEAYLRIDKNRNTFTGYYSENGTDWMMIGEHEVSMIDPKVGIITANSFIVGMTAYFDYFTVMEMP